LKPRYLDAISHRASCYSRVGDHNQALTDISEAVALAPKNKQFWQLRGWINRELGNFDKSIEDCSTCISLDPKDSLAWAARGSSERKLGELHKSLDDLTEAIKIAPEKSMLYCERAAVYRDMGDIASMNADYDKGIELSPHDPEVYQGRGYTDFIVGNYEAANADFHKVVAVSHHIYRTLPYAYLLGALSCRFLKRNEDADDWLDRAVARLTLPVASRAGGRDAAIASGWPGPALQYLHGDITAQQLLNAAAGKKDRLTEAYCYIGLQKMVEQAPGAANDLNWVIEHGNKNFVEYEIAMARQKQFSSGKSSTVGTKAE
jgi:lipoprotein NlpI